MYRVYTVQKTNVYGRFKNERLRTVQKRTLTDGSKKPTFVDEKGRHDVSCLYNGAMV